MAALRLDVGLLLGHDTVLDAYNVIISRVFYIGVHRLHAADVLR
jgi:hypothetical protein